MIKTRFLVALVLCPWLLLTGCSGYQLRGKVVDGPTSMVMVVDEHDPRLNQAGLEGASVEVTVDPRSLGRKRLPAVTSEGDGSFAVPIGEVGAGFLQYDVRVLARLAGRQSAEDEMALPGGDKRLLIILAPGQDTYQPTGGADDFLNETLEMSRPYLRE